MIIDICDNKNQLVDTKSKSDSISSMIVMDAGKEQEDNVLYYYYFNFDISNSGTSNSIATKWVTSTEWTGTNNNEVYFSGSIM